MTQLYENPEYTLRKPNWILARDLYEGRHEVLARPEYLWYHIIETKEHGEKLRARREERTRYLNLSEILCSLLCSLFLKQEPKYDKALEKLLESHGGKRNIDGRGTSISAFIKNKILPSYFNYGKVILIADALPIIARNKREEAAVGVRPFLDLIDPLQFKDWSRETDDPKRMMSFQMARYEYDGVLPRQSSKEEPRLRRFSHEYTRQNNRINLTVWYNDVDVNGSPIKPEDNPQAKAGSWQGGETITLDSRLSEIPIAVWEDESWLKDANQETLRHFNIRSNRDNINYNQGFQEKFITKEGGKMDATQLSAFNEYTHHILAVGENAFVIEPIDPIALEKAEAESLRNVFRVGLNRLESLPDSSRESSSADAQDKYSQYTYKLVEAALGEIEDILNQSLKHYAAFAGVSNFEGKVELDKEVSEESFEQFIEIWHAFSDGLSLAPTVKVEAYKKALTKLRLRREKMPELEADLEKALVQLNRPSEALTEEDPISKILKGSNEEAQAADRDSLKEQIQEFKSAVTGTLEAIQKTASLEGILNAPREIVIDRDKEGRARGVSRIIKQ